MTTTIHMGENASHLDSSSLPASYYQKKQIPNMGNYQEFSFTHGCLLPLTTRRNRYPTWGIIKSSPLPMVVCCVGLGNDICVSLLPVGIPILLDDVVESLSWILDTAPLPFVAAYHNVVKMLY
jgi:hypothetical protein